MSIVYVAIVSIAHPVLKLAGPRPHRRHHGARLVSVAIVSVARVGVGIALSSIVGT